ncbi:unnamed protein product, partial [Eruca vesicaria subsp. sativa]|nr:unnamed protein product [Eruca vesicaria subsp. sativa]
MASSSGNRKYPLRLYQIGKTPIQKRSMNQSCFLANIQMMQENIGEDVWPDLRESFLVIQSSHEVWSLIEDQPMMLNCDPFDTQEEWDVAHEDFWVEMKVPISEGPK